MDKQEKILTQGIKFIVRDNSSKNEFEEGFTNHVPFILDVNEIQIRLFRESIQAENDHGADLEIIREDTGFITSRNRFVDAKEAMRITVKTGQYPDYEFRKKVCLHEIEEANENKKHNQENIGFDGQLYVADIGYLENKIKEYDSLLERDYLKPEDLY